MDRVQLPRTSAHGKDSTPFALSFARNPSHLDVAIPDPSFWAWPEMLIPPYWELVHDAKIAKWADKPMRAFWRGGTARNSGLREVLIHCGKNSKHRGKGVTFDMKNAVRKIKKFYFYFDDFGRFILELLCRAPCNARPSLHVKYYMFFLP